jgi:hypothetical protein
MKVLFKILVLTLAAGVGLAVGFALRRNQSFPNTEAEAGNATVESAEGLKHEPKSRGKSAPLDDSPLATQLERDLSMSQGVTRWLLWFDAIERATLADFPRLIRIAKNTPAAMRLLTDRWIEIGPQHLFDTLVAVAKGGTQLSPDVVGSLTKSLLDQWTKLDPKAILAALEAAGDFGPREDWCRDVAVKIVEVNPEMGLRLMAEWHVSNYIPRMTGIAKWAAENPGHAAEFALAHPSGIVTERAMETIGGEWAKTDPKRALEFAASQHGRYASTLANAVLKEWSVRDLKAASDWLAAADSRTRNNLGAALVESWAKQDAAGALDWVDSNLSGSSLLRAVTGLMKGAAEKDVRAAAQLVSSLSPSTARSQAAMTVAEKWFPEFSENKPVEPAALTWLASLDNDSMRVVLDEVTWSWAGADVQSLAHFLSSRTSDQVSDHSFNTTARELARKNPLAAMEWANTLPADRATSAGEAAFWEWWHSQPEAAITWLGSLASTDSRRKPLFSTAIRNVSFDPNAVQRLAALPASEKPAAMEVIRGMQIPEERRTRLLAALQVP